MNYRKTGAVATMKRMPLLLCLAVLTIPLSASAQLADSGWPDYGGGCANQHRSPYVGIPDSPRLAWTFDLKTVSPQSYRGFHQPILLEDGTIVLNTADTSYDKMVALNPDGTCRWYSGSGRLGPWLAADQNHQIYTLTEIGASTYLQARTFSGSGLWNAMLSGTNPTQNGPAIGLDGRIYAANDFSPLYAINTGGTAAWQSVSSGYYVNPAIDSSGMIYIGGRNLTALRPDGSVSWTYPATGSNATYVSPAVGDDGTIYAGAMHNPNLVAMSPAGTLIWRRGDLGGAPSIGTNGNIYVVPESGVLYALDPANGATLWSYATGRTDYYDSEGVTIDSAGNLYLCNESGILMSFTPQGHLRWSLDLAPNRSGYIGPSAPVIGNDGTLYVVGGYTGKVFAIVPEPSTVAILAIGALGLLGWAFRRKRA